MGKQIHPDKNSDGRADQAFVAVDEAYNLLSDPQARESYHESWSLEQSSQPWLHRHEKVGKIITATHTVVSRTAGIVSKVVGPFSVPVSILAVVFV